MFKGRAQKPVGRPGEREPIAVSAPAVETPRMRRERAAEKVRLETPRAVDESIIFGLTVAAAGAVVRHLIRENEAKAANQGLDALEAYYTEAEAPVTNFKVTKRDGSQIEITTSEAGAQALIYANRMQRATEVRTEHLRQQTGDQTIDPIAKARQLIDALRADPSKATVLQQVEQLAGEQWHIIADGELKQMSTVGYSAIHQMADRMRKQQPKEGEAALTDEERAYFKQQLPAGMIRVAEERLGLPLHLLPGGEKALSAALKLLPGGFFIDHAVMTAIKGLKGGPEQVLSVLRQVFADNIRGQDMNQNDIRLQLTTFAAAEGITINPAEVNDFVDMLAADLAFDHAEQYAVQVTGGKVVTQPEDQPEFVRLSQVAGVLDLYQPEGMSLTRANQPQSTPHEGSRR